ncbi:hypothetical protein ABZP36_023826 [Zizania latifolia]
MRLGKVRRQRSATRGDSAGRGCGSGARGAGHGNTVVIAWCGPCRIIAPVFADLTKKHPNVVFLKVDVDELKPIAEQFSVEAIPTFLFMKEEDVKDRVVGSPVESVAVKKIHFKKIIDFILGLTISPLVAASITDRFGMPIQAEGAPRKLADPFDFGGGHIEPDRAVDPGLVYDIEPREYTKFFKCTHGSFDECESYTGQLYQLNLPSIAVPDLKNSVIVWRTVTNVGATEASYHARIEAPAGTTMSVEPSVIKFANNTRTATFKITFMAKQRVQGGYTFGSLKWLDETGSVAITWVMRARKPRFERLASMETKNRNSIIKKEELAARRQQDCTD